MREDVKKFWDEAHSAQHWCWLTGSHIDEVWTYCNINDFLKPDIKVLNIGVGFGYCTKELHEKGLIVDVLDISEIAIANVKEFSRGQYLSKYIYSLPVNKYDVAVSHLVTQHINDKELSRQVKYVLRSLKTDGIFAMQFALVPGDNRKYEEIQSEESQMKGGVVRTFEQIQNIVLAQRGCLSWVSEERTYSYTISKWQYIHIKQKI